MMSSGEPVLDSQGLSKWEIVAHTVLEKFPGSTLEVTEGKSDRAFEISLQGECLLILDKRGVRYFFPSHRKRAVTWEKVNSAGLPRVSFYILRDLAEANYRVLSKSEQPISKRPVHISRYTKCPECKQGGGIKLIVREELSKPEASELFVPILFSPDTKGAQITCTGCGWVGIRGELARKRRYPRN